MKNTPITLDSVPVAVYNTAVPECIAIFRDRQALVKYLLKSDSCPEKMSKNVFNSLSRKRTIRPDTTKLGLKLAIRNANSKQLALLGTTDCVVLVDYIPAVRFNELIAFNTSRIALAEDHKRPGLTQPNAIRKEQHKGKILHLVPFTDTNPCSRYDWNTGA